MKPTLKANMSKNLITIDAGAPLKEAYTKMRDHQIRHLPVVDIDGNVCGLISDRDLQRAMKSTMISFGFDMKTEHLEFDTNARVKDYLNWPVTAFDRDTDLIVVVRRMLRDKISSILVTDMDQVVGITTTDDLLKVLANLLEDENRLGWSLETLLTNPAFMTLSHNLGESGV